MKTTRGKHLYDADGLAITLLGVKISRCPKCGESEVAIPRINDLERTIAQVIIEKRARLAPPEIRFLRKFLDWSGSDFAAHMGVTPEAVSRWEQGATPMGTTADRLLRAMVVLGRPVEDYSIDLLKDVAREAPKPVRLSMRSGKKGWKAEAA